MTGKEISFDSEEEYKQHLEIFIYTIILIVLLVTIICIFLLEVQLICWYTNSIYTFVDDVEIVKIGIAKTHMSAFKKSGKYLAHWDIVCQDKDGNYYFVYATKPLNLQANPRGDPLKESKKRELKDSLRCISDENDIEFKGTRCVYIQAYSKMKWKYKISELYSVNTTLYTIAKEYNKQLSQKYNALYNNCYHSARKTINVFHKNAIKNKEFTLIKTLVDLKNIV